MKDKIMYMIIGILIGAVITAGGFLIFGKKGKDGRPSDIPEERMQMDDGNVYRDRGNRGENTVKSEDGNSQTQENEAL